MSKIRINELARELEVKPNVILDVLPELGFHEKKTHSSSLDDDVALAVRRRLAPHAAENGLAVAETEPPAVPPPAEHEPEKPVQELPPVSAQAEPSPVAAPAPPPEEAPKEAAETAAPTRSVPPIRPPLAGGPPLTPPLMTAGQK